MDKSLNFFRLIFLPCKIEILNILYFIFALISYNLVAFNMTFVYGSRDPFCLKCWISEEPLESGFPDGSVVKKLPANVEDTSFDSCTKKIP